jgi:hypothetical protein
MSLPVFIRKDHIGESYEDPPYHMQDRLHKDRESAVSRYPKGTMFWRPWMTADLTGFVCTRQDAKEEGITCAIIRDGDPEPEGAEIILIRKRP